MVRPGTKKGKPIFRHKRSRNKVGGPQKPEHLQHYLTITEAARALKRDPSYLRKLERKGRIPEPNRIQCGKLRMRLYSPTQIEEIQEILSTMRRGRPPK